MSVPPSSSSCVNLPLDYVVYGLRHAVRCRCLAPLAMDYSQLMRDHITQPDYIAIVQPWHRAYLDDEQLCTLRKQQTNDRRWGDESLCCCLVCSCVTLACCVPVWCYAKPRLDKLSVQQSAIEQRCNTLFDTFVADLNCRYNATGVQFRFHEMSSVVVDYHRSHNHHHDHHTHTYARWLFVEMAPLSSSVTAPRYEDEDVSPPAYVEPQTQQQQEEPEGAVALVIEGVAKRELD